MKALTTWSKTHTFVVIAAAAVGGYFLYKHYHPTTGATTNFTGNSPYFNATGKKK